MENKLRYSLNVNSPFKVFLDLQVKKAPVRVFIRIFNPNLPNTFAYSRKQDFEVPTSFNYKIGVPDFIPPLVLEVYTDKLEPASDYVVPKFRVQETGSTIKEIPMKHREAIKFLREFSLKAGFLEPNKTYSNGNIQINYLPYITYENGQMHTTPARIHKTENFIEVSKFHFDRMPTPRRNAILFHELAHNFISRNPNSEEEADDHSADLYSLSGFPPSEFIYGFSTIFRQHNPKEFANMMKDPNYQKLHSMQVNRLRRMINKMSNK